MEVIVKLNYDEMSKAAAAVVADILNTKPDAVLGMATGRAGVGTGRLFVRGRRCP